ncbi:restriction endonuclease [Gottfriedia luciferensis]|uniref:restriction endonuclease n=1 Tax=Gottfriedia luciferensis TaxID=178774 RepID=UPI000B454A6E|nr:restriction endonuclease [Gottfriedia luciferensis]
MGKRKRRSYSRKGYGNWGGKYTFYGVLLVFGVVIIYNLFITFVHNLKIALSKIPTWGLKEWLICIFIVGGLATLYILADRQTKRRYFTDQAFRPFNPKKGRTIFEITAGFSSRDFEIFVADLYRYSGYHTEVTPQSNDNGKDIILTKNKEITYVECKMYSEGNNIGRPPLQKLHGAMSKDKIERGLFITTSAFTKTAQDYVRGTGIELVDGYDLVKLIGKVRPELIYEDIVPETEPIL